MNSQKAMLRVYVIIGSTRPGRIGRSIAEWYTRVAKARYPEIHFELIDLAKWELPMLDEPVPAKAHSYQHDHTKRWSTKMREADGYIIVTPEYNNGYPAALKNALDYLYHEWRNKPVSLIGYSWNGGQSALGQLQQVVSALGMNLLGYIAIFLRPTMFGGQGQLLSDGLSEYVGKAIEITDEVQDAMTKEAAA